MEINEEFYFNSKNHISIENIKNALDSYSDNFEKAKELNNIPIFLDTNVLLNYYGMSSKEKNNLINFFNEKKEFIYLTKQVETEFIRNRVSNINEYFDSLGKLKETIEKEFIKDIKNKFKSVLENKILKEDYSSYWLKINSQLEKLSSELLDEKTDKEAFFESIDEEIKVNKHIRIKDELLNTLKDFEVLDELNTGEINFLKKEYSTLVEEYKKAKDSIKHKLSFPGCGEKKPTDKADGDFIIYHEILKFLKEKKTDAIFLTNDTTKSDWIDKKGEPFIHYIEKTFFNTSQNLYIFNANRLLENISFERIYDNSEDFEFEEETGIIVGGCINVECGMCGTEHMREPNDYNIEFSREIVNKRQMGNEYLNEGEDYFECICGNHISTLIQAWEYPSGCLNHTEISCTDTLIIEPIIEIL